MFPHPNAQCALRCPMVQYTMSLQLALVPLVLVFVLVLLFYFYLTANFDYWRKRGVPGPKPRPLLGTFPCTITGTRNFICDLDDIYREFKHKAKFVGVFITRNPQIMIIDPQLAREILVNNFKCFMDNESSKWMNRELEPISSNNPFVLRGKEWKNKRSEIVPGLTGSKTKAMYPVIVEAGRSLAQFLKEHSKDASSGIETKNLALKFTGEVIADVIWGIKANSFQKTDCTFVDMSKKLIGQTFHAFTYFFILGIFPFARKLYSVRFFPLVTDRFFTKLTEMSLERRKDSDERQDFLGHMLQMKARKNLSTVDVVAHNLTFLFDGFETSAGVISHCLLLLARNPEAQDKLRRELKDGGEYIFYDELIRLPYLGQVISETLRIFTPLPFMAKICTEPCELTNTDGTKLLVRKDDVVLISIHAYHHDEEYYPEPEKFIPERFDEENGGTKKYTDLGVYFPFGDGPRICLGVKFGIAQTKAAVAEVIRNFHVSVDETRTISDNSLEPKGFILNLKGGIFLRFKELLSK